MYEVIADDAFARWFEGLSAAMAERVAAALDFTAAAAPRLDPGRHGRLLLWFDGTSSTRSELGLEWVFKAYPPGAWLEQYRELVQWQHEALRCLESAEVARALEKLGNAAARDALGSVAELRSCLAATRAAVGLALIRPRAHGGSAPELAATIVTQIDNVKQRLERALSVLGLDMSEIYDDEAGLRELHIDDVSPHVRVIYGLDAKRKKLLALVGDSLDRAYYGDSVRWAERRWQSYRTRQWLTALGAPAQEQP